MRQKPDNYLGNLMFSGIAKGDLFRVLETTNGKTPVENCNWYEFYKVVAVSEDKTAEGTLPTVHLLQLSSAVHIQREFENSESITFVMGEQKLLPNRFASTNFVAGLFDQNGRLHIKGREADALDKDLQLIRNSFKVRKRSNALRHAKDGGYIVWEDFSDER